MTARDTYNSSVKTAETGADRTDPDNAVAILKNRADIVRRQTFTDGIRYGAALEKLIQAVLRSCPQTALAVFV